MTKTIRWRVVRGAYQWFVLRGVSLVNGFASWADAYFYAAERSRRETRHEFTHIG